jgi:hypothetical protein
LFEAAARELKRLGAVPPPSAELLETESTALAEQKESLYAEYTNARGEARGYETIKQNVDSLLTVPKLSDRELSNTCHSL